LVDFPAAGFSFIFFCPFGPTRGKGKGQDEEQEEQGEGFAFRHWPHRIGQLFFQQQQDLVFLGC
jgi:hypothetical protein